MEEEILECVDKAIHPESIKRVKKHILSDDKIFDLAELFKVFGDTTRVKILYVVFGDSTRMKIISALLEEELCVCDIAMIINSTQSAVSHQLRVLKQAKLVTYRKSGKVVYYALADDHVRQIFEKGCEHIEEV